MGSFTSYHLANLQVNPSWPSWSVVLDWFVRWPLGMVWLLVFWAASYKQMQVMLHYFLVRKLFPFSLLLLAYLLAVLALLGFLPLAHEPLVCLLLVALIIALPYCFKSPKIRNPTSLHGPIALKGKAGQRLPINAPELGVFVLGAPGCGKTKCVIEPLVYQMIAQGYTGVVYDYDFAPAGQGSSYSLSQLAYYSCQHFKKPQRQFISINFQDLTTSSRINPIAPCYIEDRKQLDNLLHTFLLNLNPQMSQKEDFWHKNTYALLKSIIVFLANKAPAYCSLPHVIMLGLQPEATLLNLLDNEEEARLYASPILDALQGAGEQLAGVMANFKVSLQRLLDKDLFWVLSGDEVPFIVNDTDHPLVVCLGNTPTQKELLSPILAMCLAVLVSSMYAHNRAKSFVVLDELPTLYLPQLNDMPATARKYGIATIVALQNMLQLEKSYGRAGAMELQETFSNHLVGRSQYELAKYWSEVLGKKQSKSISKTTHPASGVSETKHQKEEAILSAQEIMNLKLGEFIGKVAQSDQGFFKLPLKALHSYHPKLKRGELKPLPQRKREVDVAANFAQITKEVASLLPY